MNTQPIVPAFITHANLKCKKYIHLYDEIYESWEWILQFLSSGLMKLDETIAYCWCPIIMKWSLWLQQWSLWLPIVMSYIEINKAVSQWLLTFNLCVSVTWPLTCAFHIPCTHTPEIIDMHRGMCDNICTRWLKSFKCIDIVVILGYPIFFKNKIVDAPTLQSHLTGIHVNENHWCSFSPSSWTNDISYRTLTPRPVTLESEKNQTSTFPTKSSNHCVMSPFQLQSLLFEVPLRTYNKCNLILSRTERRVFQMW